MCRPLPSFNLCALAIVGALALPRPAGAEESAKPAERVTEYREMVARAVGLFDSGHYRKARRAFRRAYRIHPDPVLLFNIGSTYRRQGDAARAVELYRRFLDEAPPDEPRRATAEETIASLEERIAARDAEDLADAGDVADSPAPAAPALVTSPRRDAGESNQPGRALRWSGLVTAAVGVVGLGAAVVEWDRSRAAEQTIEGLPAGTPWSDREAAIYEQGRASHQRSKWLGWSGGALVATGAVLYLIGVQRRGDRDDTVVQLTGGDGSVQMMVRGSF